MAIRRRSTQPTQELVEGEPITEDQSIPIEEPTVEDQSLVEDQLIPIEEPTVEDKLIPVEEIIIESSEVPIEMEKSMIVESNPAPEKSIYNSIDVNIAVLADAKVPVQKFQEGCFDIQANFTNIDSILVIKNDNSKENRRVTQLNTKNQHGIVLDAYERALIPTNLIFILPINCVMKLYSKAGVSLNSGLKLASGVDIIHPTYIDSLYVSVYNNSKIRKAIKTFDIIAQGEIVPYFVPKFNVVK